MTERQKVECKGIVGMLPTPDGMKQFYDTGRHGGGDVEAMKDYLCDYSRENPDLLNKLILYWIEKFDN
ncbi:hypothetical protein LCGC14_1035130 [marine sediment metagenome]|uniref:Uncharacterized protein n=1 Tax=marine sediment metagenome TaxID=412755 RepID=A0A0F9MY21_9ZZZZ